jgi:hypothetical protein
MDRSIGLALLSAVGALSARAELQLTPTLQENQGDGVTYKQLAFSDGAITITYRAPSNWHYFGNANQLVLRPPNKPQAEATITKIPLSQPVRFDDETVKKLITEITAAVPKESKAITVVSEQRNPIIIDGKETFLVILDYTLIGQAYRRSILFLNRATEQLRFQLTCREVDFEDLQATFFRSQFSWENL